MKDFFKRSDKSKDSTPPKITDFLGQDNVKEMKPVEEIVKIVGLCLWDIFPTIMK